MSRIWLPLAISLTAAATVAAELAHYYPELPDQVATHFDAEGFANGSMPKPQFVSMTLAVFAAIGGTLLALPVVLRIAPTRAINIPHREYWL
ncbi:MAG TPA: DUF1648 domain-containing protein, partial [Lacipirellulaceae bacterium]|nr:DUF1648 domain-containing protein [Lacipirellulaceae bacterium]